MVYRCVLLFLEVLMSDYKALYRKWRSRDFNEVYGQDGITDILKYEVKNNKLSHAYLFCGSRGTGKTSCAKILARAVNCLSPRDGNPCNECEACRSILSGSSIDVIEMDAASNNGINDVRDMQDEISFTPALLKYRVYIIDEVHMMSSQAFNALLKTLEEPPEYVIFILATTEYNKLPTTVVSRCQRFDFKRISTDIIIRRLTEIANAENIVMTEDAARIIARVSRGGMRDAISLLELCAGAHRPIDESLVFETVGSGNRESAYKMVEAIGKGNFDSVYGIIDDIVMKSGDISVFWQEIIDTYRDIMVLKSSRAAKKYLDLTDSEYDYLKSLSDSFDMARLSYHVSILEGSMADMQRAFNSKRSIAEIALTRMCDPKLLPSYESLVLRVEELEKSLSMLRLGAVATADQTKAPAAPKPKKPDIPQPKSNQNEQKSSNMNDKEWQKYERWHDIVTKISELKYSLATGFNQSYVMRSKNTFTIYMNSFYCTRLSSNPTDVELIRGCIAQREGLERTEVDIKVQPIDIKPQSPASELDGLF